MRGIRTPGSVRGGGPSSRGALASDERAHPGALGWRPTCNALGIGVAAAVDPLASQAIGAGVRRYILGHAQWVFLWPVFLAGKSSLQAHGATRPALGAGLGARLASVVLDRALLGEAPASCA